MALEDDPQLSSRLPRSKRSCDTPGGDGRRKGHLRTSERLLTANETAAILNVSVRTVRRLIADGTLPAVRIGRAVRISQDAVAQLIDVDR
jgi:excisionase family DNA binding protein